MAFKESTARLKLEKISKQWVEAIEIRDSMKKEVKGIDKVVDTYGKALHKMLCDYIIEFEIKGDKSKKDVKKLVTKVLKKHEKTLRNPNKKNMKAFIKDLCILLKDIERYKMSDAAKYFAAKMVDMVYFVIKDVAEYFGLNEEVHLLEKTIKEIL